MLDVLPVVVRTVIAMTTPTGAATFWSLSLCVLSVPWTAISAADQNAEAVLFCTLQYKVYLNNELHQECQEGMCKSELMVLAL